MAEASPARALTHRVLAGKVALGPKHGPWPVAWPLARSMALGPLHGPWPGAWPLARCMALGSTRSLHAEKWRYKRSRLIPCPCATLPLGSCPEARTEKVHGTDRQGPQVCERLGLTVPRAPSPSMRATSSPMPTQGLRLGRGPAREDGRRAEFGKNAVTEVHFLQNLPLCYR